MLRRKRRLAPLDSSGGSKGNELAFAESRGGRGAFTLLEIMLAIAIFAGVLLAIYSTWTAVLRSSRVGLKAAAEGQRTRMALRALQEAIGSAELFAANIQHYAFIADTSQDFAGVSFVARLPASFPGSGLFGDQAVRRVSFTVERGPDSRNQLILRQSPLLEPAEANVRPYSIVLAPNVRMFQMEFLDTNTFEWLPEWTLTNQLPKMIKVAINFGEGQGPVHKEDVNLRTIALSSVAIPRELQIPAMRRGVAIPPGAGGRVPGQFPTMPGADSSRGGRGLVGEGGAGGYPGGQRDFMYRNPQRSGPMPGGNRP